MRKTESQHNTADQVHDYLEAALAVVNLLDPPPELREVAFAKAVDLFSAKQVFYEQPAAIPGGILRPN